MTIPCRNRCDSGRLVRCFDPLCATHTAGPGPGPSRKPPPSTKRKRNPWRGAEGESATGAQPITGAI